MANGTSYSSQHNLPSHLAQTNDSMCSCKYWCATTVFMRSEGNAYQAQLSHLNTHTCSGRVAHAVISVMCD